METDPPPAESDAAPESAHTSGRKSAPTVPMDPRRAAGRWTVEQKQTIAADSLTPGASPTDVARLHGISTGQLYTWRRALIAAQPAAVARTPGWFARVDVAPRTVKQTASGTALAASAPAVTVAATARAPCLIEIALPDGTTLRVDAQINPGALRRVLAAVRP